MVRAKVELKSQIIDGLQKMPMTTHGVSRFVNCHYNTAKNRLEELESLGKVECFENNDKKYWRIDS